MTSSSKRLKFGLLIAGMVAAATNAALAGGVSAYLPLNLEPETERQIERVYANFQKPLRHFQFLAVA